MINCSYLPINLFCQAIFLLSNYANVPLHYHQYSLVDFPRMKKAVEQEEKGSNTNCR